MEFEWHDDKNADNLMNHHMGLSEGISVFDDINRVEFKDDRIDYGEERYVTIGMNATARVLTVVFTERGENTTRLISVRKATKAEERRYVAGLDG